MHARAKVAHARTAQRVPTQVSPASHPCVCGSVSVPARRQEVSPDKAGLRLNLGVQGLFNKVPEKRSQRGYHIWNKSGPRIASAIACRVVDKGSPTGLRVWRAEQSTAMWRYQPTQGGRRRACAAHLIPAWSFWLRVPNHAGHCLSFSHPPGDGEGRRGAEALAFSSVDPEQNNLCVSGWWSVHPV